MAIVAVQHGCQLPCRLHADGPVAMFHGADVGTRYARQLCQAFLCHLFTQADAAQINPAGIGVSSGEMSEAGMLSSASMIPAQTLRAYFEDGL